jgi:hypothetical protein
MSVFKRGKKWQYDFWVNGKRYRGSIPEARVKAQAERAEIKIRNSVYEGKYFRAVKAPDLSTFVQSFCRGAKLIIGHGGNTSIAPPRLPNTSATYG